MMDIQPSDLRYFMETARTLNISRAAERLNVGQPTLSQALQRLERTLGVQLFDRFKTGVQLTVPGHKLLEESRALLEGWEKLKQSVVETEHEISGRYSLGCHTAVALYALPKFLPKLLAEHPGLEVSLRHGLSREVLESVVSFRTDFGLVMNPVRHLDLVIRQVCEDRVSFWTSKKARYAADLQDTVIYDPALAQAQTLIGKAGNAGRTGKEKLVKSSPAKPNKRPFSRPFTRHIHSSSLEVIAALTEAGCGVGILPQRVARLHTELQLLPGSPSFEDKLCLVYRADRHLTQAAKTVISSILNADFEN
jgi:DNA-binding transcriptional LysR family regulator